MTKPVEHGADLWGKIKTRSSRVLPLMGGVGAVQGQLQVRGGPRRHADGGSGAPRSGAAGRPRRIVAPARPEGRGEEERGSSEGYVRASATS